MKRLMLSAVLFLGFAGAGIFVFVKNERIEKINLKR